MIAYGDFKRGNKVHPHNECEICSEKTITKKRERRNSKKEIEMRKIEKD